MRKWKVVFWIAAFFFTLDLIKLPFRANLNYLNFIWVIVWGFSLFPLYGYAYQIAIGSKTIAIAIFSFNTFITLAAFLIAALVNLGMPSIFTFIGLVVGLSILLAFIYPQFLYAFKSDQLWSEHA